MRQRGALARRVGAVLALAAWCAFGCSQTEEEKLEEAVRELGRVRQTIESARAEVAEREKASAEAEAALSAARTRLRDAEKRLAEVESRVDTRATDEVLFRTIQKRLLEDDELEDVAISARVSQGVVMLSGSVDDARLRDRAVEIARSIPGSAAVESQIAVKTAPVAAEPPAKQP